MKPAVLILPNQLFEKHEILIKSLPIYLYEHPRFFTDFNFHKQKLVLHRASLKTYYDYLKAQKLQVYYLEYHEELFARLAKDKITELHIADPVDHQVELDLKKTAHKYNINLINYDNPNFINTVADLKKDFDPHADRYLMTAFYIKQRKRLNILVQNGKPVGGKWSFDAENRKKLPPHISLPALWTPKLNDYVAEAINYVEHRFKQNYGTVDNFYYPTNFKDAQKWLQDFLNNRLKHFGDYEDAIDVQNQTLYHSMLSPLLNVGLLNPLKVVTETINFAQNHNIPLNSLEGFIRQIIGWREYIRAMYHLKGEFMRESNFFNHQRKLPQSFWTGNTGLEILDTLIAHLQSTAYLHHIERLMVFGNFMLLCEIDPNDVYTWYMENFIDAYDWVMVPNVYGMSQFSDGGLMMTKPYISSSNYLLKMSNFKKGSWCEIWDALFWHFIYNKQKILAKIPRAKIMLSYLTKLGSETLEQHIKSAILFLKNFK